MADCGQFFKCVSPANFKPLTSTIALGIIAGVLIIADILVAIVSGAAVPGLGVVAGILLIAAIFELCAFLSGGKLVCLGDNSCTIGRIMEIIPVGSDKSGFEKIDDDFTMNTLPSPHSPEELLSEMTVTDPTQGPFLNPQTATTNLGLPFAGVSVKFDNIGHDTDVFHVEVKGCRVHDVCNVWKALSFGAPVVGFICSIPLIGWLVCAIAALIWLIITAIATAIAWAATHSGDINDVYDPAAGELTAADPKTGAGGDVILVRGDWVYDAGHSGWNEIQPIRFVQKLTAVVDPKYQSMAKADASLVAEFKKDVLDPWCFFVGQASDPLTVAAQDDPPNTWGIHPSIDGCDPEPAPLH
jgi:hypothetical protein